MAQNGTATEPNRHHARRFADEEQEGARLRGRGAAAAA
jgi:hypothetical protein